MKKIVALSGVIAFLAVVLVFSACATLGSWWGSWIWAPAVLISQGQDGQTIEKPEIILSGSVENPKGLFIDENGEEFVMTKIVIRDDKISFVVKGETKKGTFKFNEEIIQEETDE